MGSNIQAPIPRRIHYRIIPGNDNIVADTISRPHELFDPNDINFPKYFYGAIWRNGFTNAKPSSVLACFPVECRALIEPGLDTILRLKLGQFEPTASGGRHGPT